jgi:hypothetical protein
MPVCDRSGRHFEDPQDGIFDDGEWLSWAWINHEMDRSETRQEYPGVEPEVSFLFRDLVDLAREYRDQTGRYLQIWGELGELYAEVKFGVRRHKAHAQGSDGRLGNDFIEVKTISPEKTEAKVRVKLSGHFSKLLIVRITPDFAFEARFIERAQLVADRGPFALAYW